MNYNYFILFYTFLISSFSLFLILGIFLEFKELYIILVTFLLILFGFRLGKLSPSFLFVLSIVIFIWMRPLMSLFFNSELVQAGYSYTEENLTNTIGYIGLVISLIIFSYYLNFRNAQKISKFYNFSLNYKFKLNKYLKLLLYGSILSGVSFIYISYQKMSLMGLSSYFEVTSDSNFYEHLFLFFVAKQLMILYLLLESNKNKNFVILSLIMFIFSIGFVLIGLRGFTIAYMFTFLFFINLRYKINFIFLFLVGIMLIYIASIVIEFRLGYQIYDGFVDIIKSTLHSQGASFEVVYGSVNYQEGLKQCLSYSDYFMKKIPFGDCVDSVRGVYFAEGGGFASAFFAEILYFSYLGVIVFSYIIGFVLSLLDQLYLKIKQKSKEQNRYYIYILFFLIVPNLVYIGRASAFDLIFKFIISTLMIFFIINLVKILRKFTMERL